LAHSRGNIIRPHTNLTEIKLAVELLWRVGVKPSQVSIGFGFYGRSFTLTNPSCSTPGQCRFSGGGAPGMCTGTSGYLAYYEIQNILAQNPGIVVHHDQEAAIKYITWGNGQWVSYDDADTFRQKVDWANSVGFSGSLIWASDLGTFSISLASRFPPSPLRLGSCRRQQSQRPQRPSRKAGQDQHRLWQPTNHAQHRLGRKRRPRYAMPHV
jgi:GH18 family chitinase